MKKATQHSTYQIFEDVLALAGSFAKLGRTMAADKIQSTADSASTFIHSKVELPDLSAQLSGATESLGHVSDYALHTDVKHMVDDVGAFVRKHPVTALISVIAVGAMFGRLLLRSEPVVEKAPVKPIKRAAQKTRAKAKTTKAKTTKLAAKPHRKTNGTTQAHA